MLQSNYIMYVCQKTITKVFFYTKLKIPAQKAGMTLLRPGGFEGQAKKANAELGFEYISSISMFLGNDKLKRLG